MNIFYFLPEKNTIMCRWQRDHFIEELSHHGVNFHLFNPLFYRSWDEANEAAIVDFNKGKYSLFMTGVCDKALLFEETLSTIKRYGVPTLCIRFDNLVIPLDDKDMAPSFDLLWLTSIETKRLYDKWGAKTCFAPYAANPYTFQYREKENIRRVCFVGTPYGSRPRLFNNLTRGGVDLTLFYGNSTTQTIDRGGEHFETFLDIPSTSHMTDILNRVKFKEGMTLIKGSIKNKLMGKCAVDNNSHLIIRPAVPPLELSEIYSEYVLSLASSSAHHTDVLKNPLKIVNLRNFEIAMSGGVEICRYHAELADYFVENKEIVFYRSNEEMVDKALYYTRQASDTEIRNIRRAARTRSENEHTWWNRFSVVFERLGIK